MNPGLAEARPKSAPKDAATKRAHSGPSKLAQTAQRKTQVQSEQRELQQRLTRMKKRLAAAEATHSEATDALRSSEAAISDVNRRLRELATAREALQRQIAAVQERNRAVVARQTEQERQLGQVMRLQFAVAQTGPWQSLMDGENPAQIGRDVQYLDYISRAKAQLIAELRSRREELTELETESRSRQVELAALADDERDNRVKLLQQQTLRKQTLERTSREIATQRQSIATLERDERRLANLVEQLSKVMAEQTRQRERAPATTARAPVPAAAPASADPPASAWFAQQRGKLVLPIKGEVAARFGSPRRTEAGVDAPTWKGVFIRAAAGTDVHAVAAGRVIFADWLRGFGNLLILDHGEGFISVYGNNATLLRSAGDRVSGADVVAEVGNTGGHPEPGLYFEMRYQGRPMDPLRWALAR